MRRIMLFISSYIPLYILLIFKNILERCTKGEKFAFSVKAVTSATFFDEINDYAIVVLSLLIVLSFVYLKVLTSKSEGIHYYKITSVDDQTGTVYFNYISIYLLSCLGLSLNSIVDVFVLFFVMAVVGYIYISNHMTYMNPVLQFLGYKVYEGEVKSLSTDKIFKSIIIVDKRITINTVDSYAGSGKEDFIVISQKNQDKR